MTAAIECVELSKVYSGRIAALHDVSFAVPAGASFGLLGENGAGKSTLVRLIMGFLHPSAGSVHVWGEKHVSRVHARIGYVHERPLFEPRFSGREYLIYSANLAGLWTDTCRARVDAVLEQVDLTRAATRNSGTYSKGMLQRLAIAQALLTNPDLLILDEITSGLDPGSQYEVRRIIESLHAEGKTIFLCSHYLAEVETLCDTVGILRRGELAAFGSVATLLAGGQAVELVFARDTPAQEIMDSCDLREVVLEAKENSVRIPASAQQAVLSVLVRAGVPIQSLNPVSQSLEDVYVRVTRARNPAGESAARPVASEAGSAGVKQ